MLSRSKVLLVLTCTCLWLAAGAVGADALPEGFRLEPVFTGLTAPSSVVAAPDGRILITERTTGSLRAVVHGQLQAGAACQVSVDSSGERGLLGVAVHPQFNNNGWVYLYYTYDLGGGDSTNRIERFTAAGNRGINGTIILDDIGVGLNGEDNGGALAFGPDGKLYATVGVMEIDSEAASLDSLGGKVLRMNDDGSVPTDNPQVGLSYPYNLIYAWGFRNPAGIKFNELGTLYVTDNTDDEVGVDCDEVNVVVEGLDYGWNTTFCDPEGLPPSPMHAINPKITAWDITPYAGDKLVATCGTAPSVECADDSECGFCDNQAKPCTSDSDCYTCQANPSRACTTDAECGYCDNDASVACSDNTACNYCDLFGGHCLTSADCPFGVTCHQTGSCLADTCDSDATCPPAKCGQPADYMFVAGKTGGITRDVVTGANKDELAASIDFYEPTGACPSTVTGVTVADDGTLFVTAADTDPGLYRLIYDTNTTAPRETAATPYAPLTVAKSGGGLEFLWEDLKRDAWRCSEGRTYCSNEYLTYCDSAADCPAGGTCDVRPCPAGSADGKYTVWSGTLAALSGGYDHTVLAETDATDSSDALVSHTETTMPDGNAYFLVSARGNNLEGSTGFNSEDVERPGASETDLCNDIGWGSAERDYELCFGDFPTAYADQNNKLWTMDDLRGKTLMFSAMQYG